MKLNNKGVSIIEIVLTFALIMVMTMGMLSIVFNYREKASISMEKLDLDTFKNTLTKEIQDDILTLGVKEINTSGECLTNAELNSCINIVFLDGTSKAFGTSKVNNNDVDTMSLYIVPIPESLSSINSLLKPFFSKLIPITINIIPAKPFPNSLNSCFNIGIFTARFPSIIAID